MYVLPVEKNHHDNAANNAHKERMKKRGQVRVEEQEQAQEEEALAVTELALRVVEDGD